LSFERPGPGVFARVGRRPHLVRGRGPLRMTLARRADARAYLENCIAVSGEFLSNVL
jgi:hypothetical protein